MLKKILEATPLMVLFLVQQMDLTRFLQVYIAQGLIGVFFLFFAYKILKHSKRRLNLTLSGCYFTISIGIFINFIYAPLTNESIVLILYYATIFFLLINIVFLLMFVIILQKSEKVITLKKQLIITIIYAVLLLCMVLIPEGVTINESTEWKPVYSLVFFLYIIILLFAVGFTPTLIISIQIYKQFQDELIKKRWRFFIIGTCLLYFFAFGTYLSNTLNVQTFRTIWSIISIFLVITSPYLIYYGVVKKLKK